MDKYKLYLDTSIPSAFYDRSKPVRQLITQKWFENESKKYKLFSSIITIAEVDKIENNQKKENIKKLFFEYKIKILELTDEAMKLSEKYIQKGAMPHSEPEDSLHIAIAVMNDITFLASWNFKHIVSINPIRKIHEINIQNNLPYIEIGSLELFGGYKYGNL